MQNMAYKYRIYPTESQICFFAKSFGCCRFIWNTMLNDKQAYYREHKKTLKNTPAQYKETYPWLKEVDSLALANVQLQLETAFKNFFERPNMGYPKFKAKHKGKNSYTTNNQNGTVTVGDDWISLPKIGKIRAVIHRKPEEQWKLKSATVSRSTDGNYWCSVLYEYEAETSQIAVRKTLGLDYKSDGLYMDSEGNSADMPKYYRISEKKLARAQRRLSKKQNGSRNREKAKHRIAVISRHVQNQRADFLHKTSHQLAEDYDLICIEDLNMASMKRSLHLGKATSDNGWGMFTRMLDYKLLYRGKSLIKVDRMYPSSQLCQCGYQNPITKDLSVRTVTCPKCGRVYDRDCNAAINVKKEGYRLYQLSLSEAV